LNALLDQSRVLPVQFQPQHQVGPLLRADVCPLDRTRAERAELLDPLNLTLELLLPAGGKFVQDAFALPERFFCLPLLLL